MAVSGKTSAHYRSLLAAFNQASVGGGGQFSIKLMRTPKHLILRIEGQVAIPHSQALVDKVRPVLAAAKGPKELIVDLARCRHLASSAIGFIAFVAMEMAKRGGAVHLVNASPPVMSMLRVLGVEKTLRIADSVAAVTGEDVKLDG